MAASRSRRSTLQRCWLVLALICGAPLVGMGQDEIKHAQQVYRNDLQPLLQTYCYDCHQADSAEADLNLEKLTFPPSELQGRKTWQLIVEQLSHGVMPPEDAEPLPAETRRRLIEGLTELMDRLDCRGNPDPGQVTLRRLNRIEYRNTVRDLLGVDYQPAEDFPADDVGYGFDNIGDVLSLPPILMEKYLDAAETISQQAIATDRRDQATVQRIAASKMTGKHLYPAGSGAVVIVTNSSMTTEVQIADAGEYEIRVYAHGDQAGDEPVSMSVLADREKLETFQVRSTAEQADSYFCRTKLRSGAVGLAVSFNNDYYQPKAKRRDQRDRNLVVHFVEVRGPLAGSSQRLPQAHRRYLTTVPGQHHSLIEAARQTLQPLASRAFRRPVRDQEVRRLIRLVELAVDHGDSFETGIQLALQAMLVSPHFLFKVETPPPNDGSDRLLSEFELATSLSYFLWSSMPDEILTEHARQGTLRANLSEQVHRMLADRKSQALVDNFALQWLQLRSLDGASPDPDRFPRFTPQLRDWMRQETQLFVSDIVRNDHSILDLLSADFTYLNQPLAEHYGVDSVQGNDFRRVQLSPDTHRGGLLTHGSVLTVTSNPTRTSPVKRGKWILENLLGTPPPPPADDVMSLEDQEELTGTLRERMEQHRRDPNCATCHQKMDPLGFALEHYDAVGQWRLEDEGHAIDASGQLPSGESIRGADQLQSLLVTTFRESFVRCVSEKLLTYALGRGLEYDDACAIEEIMKTAAKNDHRFSALVLAVVESDPFQKRRRKREN